ncbi:hypothetical protein CN271_06995 [Bacillus cereus]|uniref:hypothetical protein n=1 Tax=Bacillus cereus TaxID=1396 RepID=UPI000BECC855|nr:hypothetical protein [Bacillus cereus]PEE33595.1 hypothetical protein CON59_24725 [Bacillus cereus]PET45013.1 hypothetical protein CN523_17235 [Bacillus cereus]PEV76571.1 hypothetical protein CN429_20165 [Bacillus cereus]PFA49995.1 hypothetical protein CN389_23965 [Bacillus cereus]PFD77827.1 hypothetical protein CN271_06995 [Bacillus cereus]
MEMQSSKQKKRPRIFNSLLFWVSILIILFLFKSAFLQIIGILLIIAFICLGFYYLGYLLFGIISLIIVVGSVIFAICILGYFL